MCASHHSPRGTPPQKRSGKVLVEWETRYNIVLGLAHAIAYLHHDCVPAILHGDVKSMNVLLGSRFDSYLADFGLARVVSWSDNKTFPHIAGSYGYMAPEYASMQRITEKSDVYSYGVVLLEVVTGRHPVAPALPRGMHLVEWVRDHLQRKCQPVDLVDARLQGRAEYQMQEMQQALAISILCTCPLPDDRPTMKDVVAMLKEIRRTVSGDGKEPSACAPAASPVSNVELQQASSSCSLVVSDYSS